MKYSAGDLKQQDDEMKHDESSIPIIEINTGEDGGRMKPLPTMEIKTDENTYAHGTMLLFLIGTEKALRALEVLNFTPLNGTPIRVMCESGPGNIFIKNLDKAIDRQALHDTFSSFGNILSCRVATDPSGQSKGYGFVQYDSEEAAQKAIETLNGMLLNDKQVYVGPFLQKQEREMALDKVKFTNVFIKNLSESTTEEDLKKIFGDAARSVESLNGQKIETKAWFVGKAQKKSERELELKNRFEQTVKEAADKSQGLNLYFKNLDDSIGDDKLEELFSRFGIITSYKVMRDPSGVSRGSGFVAFSTPEEASRALLEMNGKMIVSKPLYVAHAQRKEDRRAILQAQFCPVVMAPLVAPRMPMYPPGGPGLGQQIFYGQAPPAIIPPRPDFGYQQQLVPGMRPGGGPIPNFFVPMVQRVSVLVADVQEVFQGSRGNSQFHLCSNRCFRGGGSTASPQDMACLVLLEACFPSLMIWVACLCMMGECLNQFQLVLWLLPLQMLLLLTRGQCWVKICIPLWNSWSLRRQRRLLACFWRWMVLHLLESPEALKAKVAEAMEVLKNVQQQQASNPADQLA
ncbi:hypothetical protein TEA_001433 [Camellia sinensis var. sinensis]|uniref:RRM domain-containing protein n=1 Tax=Camellia sinensis var. sinensis TaxID=542762 RepID=A0A4V3WQW1_CAMSN|nr:hypothetical protein TEA_001433 [Camellia sinensis var. sinensis]